MASLQQPDDAHTLSPTKTFLLGGLTLLLILLAYRHALDNFFVGDDFPWLYHVINMRHHFVEGIRKRYTWMGSSFSFYLDLLIFRTNPWGYNLTNLLIHLVNVILVGLLGYYLTKDRLVGVLSMILWGINAQGAEVILWKTGRGHSLVLLFLFGALILFILWEQKRKRWWLYGCALLSYICAQLTLFNAVILPGLLGCYLLIFNGIPRKLSQGIDYFKILFPFGLITGIYLFFYVFVFTTLTPSSYYTLKGSSLIIRFGKYLLDYLLLFPELFAQITYNDKLLSYLGGIVVVAFLAALIFIRQKTVRFMLIWMVATITPYLPIIGTWGHQPSRYRYIPLVGFSVILSIFLMFLKNLARSSHFFRRGIVVFIVVFLVLVLIGNIYYITLIEKDYDKYGTAHRTLVRMVQNLFEQIPLGKMIVFINHSNIDAPEVLSNHMNMPQLLFVRPGAPWKLVYIEQLLTLCAYTSKKSGVFVLQDKHIASQHIRAGEYTALALSNEGFYWLKLEAEHLEETIQALGDQNTQRPVMALRYINPEL